MKKSRFTEEQLVKILREADRSPVPEVAKRYGISDPTIYAWRKRFGKLEPADVRRLRHLEQEKLKHKKLVAERDLGIEVMREVARKYGERHRTKAAGPLRARARSVDSPGMPAARSSQLDVKRSSNRIPRATAARVEVVAADLERLGCQVGADQRKGERAKPSSE